MYSFNSLKEKLNSQTKQLEQHPYVTNIILSDNIVINTTEIKVDGVVPIGPYEIKLSILNDPKIIIRNKNNPRNNYEHPHVQDGLPCWGNYSDVYVHLAELDLLSTAEIVFRFLENWNPEDSWGKNLVYWDVTYTFDTLTEMGLLDTVESHFDEYYIDYSGGSHLPQAEVCNDCGEHYDYCTCYCSNCGDHNDDCMCDRCPECSRIIDECYCERCDWCGSLLDDCECERCSECDANITAGECCCERCF